MHVLTTHVSTTKKRLAIQILARCAVRQTKKKESEQHNNK